MNLEESIAEDTAAFEIWWAQQSPTLRKALDKESVEIGFSAGQVYGLTLAQRIFKAEPS